MQNELPVRKNVRLQGYDYSQPGYYFVTICVRNRHEMLGSITVGAGSCRPRTGALIGSGLDIDPAPTAQVILSDYGETVRSWIDKISIKYNHVAIDKYVIMPNHIHLILIINDRRRHDAAPTPTLGRIMGYYKHQTTKEINIPGFWQRSYHDHVIRDDAEYQRIWQYIDENPARWTEDRYYAN